MHPLLKAGLALLGLAFAPGLPAAAPLTLDLKVDRPLITADRDESVILRLGVKADPGVTLRRRAPLNLALVLDRSGSMEGNKMRRLREAARQAVGRLRSDDVLTIIAFDSSAKVILPAGKVGNRRAALRAVEGLEAGGSTALYGGVSQGLRQLREYKGRDRVSRLILISDGLANVGPSTPSELAGLGREAGGLGIPVTTFGLGLDFGEDLMTRLALASDGNHAFIPDEGGLAAYFDKELGEALAVTARDLVIEITLKPGVRFKSSLDREVEADGRVIRWKLNQLPGGVEKRLLLELEAPALGEGAAADLASAKVVYADSSGRSQAPLNASVIVKAASAPEADKAEEGSVAAEAALARANQKREVAIQLRDEGKAAEAAEVLNQNAMDLDAAYKKTGSASLGSSATSYRSEAAAAAAPSAEDWNASRKSMKAKSYQESTQQSY